MVVELYIQSELVGRASTNADGTLALEGYDSAYDLVHTTVPVNTPGDEACQLLLTKLTSYPYVWAQVPDKEAS